MSDISQIKAAIRVACDTATEGIAALAQAHQKATEAEQQFNQVTEGSDQADVSEARQLAAQANQKITEAQQSLQASVTSAEAVAARL